MKKRAKWMKMTGLVAIAAVSLVLAACGARSGGTAQSSSGRYSEAAPAEEVALAPSYGNYKTDTLYESGVEMEEAMEELTEAEEGTGAEAAPVQDTSRKLITTVHMSAETDDFDAFNTTIENKTAALGGYIENASVYNGRTYYNGGENRQERNADYVIRIPAKHLDAFVNDVQELSNIIDKSRSVEDVTLTYVDIQSRKKALQTEYDRLLELVREAETVEDIIALEERIATVRYEIESIESRLRTFDNQIDYSTIYLNVREVIHFTPVAPMSAWERIRTGFAESLYDVGHGMKEFVIGFVIALPKIVVFLAVIL
ncbi:MAG: DUF4349 domain-containing protein, partial [Lachnospiraceae bacterium]|nr:DUF4349 domain-containing protein [Lachnospiraceae bacterium]